MVVYLNGEFVPHAEARIPVDDRGFLFADGVYEVALAYDGRLYEMDAHLRRLEQGLRALRIEWDGAAELAGIAERLLDENQLRTGTAAVYIQVTRGAAPRAHHFPAPAVAPTVYVAARPFRPHAPSVYENGVAAITVPDTRWTRCDIKSVSLLANVLANQQAKDAGAFEALFVRDGVVIEGSHSNLMAVFDGTIVTYPPCNYILRGITRDRVLELAAELGIPAVEGPIFADRLYDADELFLTGTTTEVMPVVRVDGRSIGSGKPGPITNRLFEAYRAEL